MSKYFLSIIIIVVIHQANHSSEYLLFSVSLFIITGCNLFPSYNCMNLRLKLLF